MDKSTIEQNNYTINPEVLFSEEFSKKIWGKSEHTFTEEGADGYCIKCKLNNILCRSQYCRIDNLHVLLDIYLEEWNKQPFRKVQRIITYLQLSPKFKDTKEILK